MNTDEIGLKHNYLQYKKDTNSTNIGPISINGQQRIKGLFQSSFTTLTVKDGGGDLSSERKLKTCSHWEP